jgi:hypothetical protein
MCALCSVFNTVQRENAAPLGGIHQYTIQPLVVGNGIVGAQRLIVEIKVSSTGSIVSRTKARSAHTVLVPKEKSKKGMVVVEDVDPRNLVFRKACRRLSCMSNVHDPCSP